MSRDGLGKDFLCSATGKPLYMPVVTEAGHCYSYAALFEMFMKAPGGVAVCKVTQQRLRYFPNVCLPLHFYLWENHRQVMRSRRQEDEFLMQDKYGLELPDIPIEPEDTSEDGWLEVFECKVSGELAYEPCVLSSGTIVSAYCVPPAGFKKDPDRFIACALHLQIPAECKPLATIIREKFPKDYSNRAKEAPPTKKKLPRPEEDTDLDIHWGLGCDGCGMWPIKGPAWYDVDCPQSVGFNLCNGCYENGYHRRVMTGRFNQTHMPTNKMAPVQYHQY